MNNAGNKGKPRLKWSSCIFAIICNPITTLPVRLKIMSNKQHVLIQIDTEL